MTESTLPLASAQLGLWLSYQLEPRNRALFYTCSYRIDGALDVQLFERAIGCVAARADALRMRFSVSGAGPVQTLRAAILPDFRVVDATGAQADWESVVAGWLERPLEIERDLPFETLLVRHRADAWIWHTKVSHLLIDGVAGIVYINAVAAAYAQLKAGTEPRLSFLGSYAAHVRGEAEEMKSPQWREGLERLRERHARPAQPVFSAGRGAYRGHTLLRRWLSPDAYTRLQSACAADGITIPAALLALAIAVAARHCERSGVPIGVATHNRKPEHRTTIGMFSGYVPLRVAVDGGADLVGLARNAHRQLREGMPLARIPVNEFANGSDPLFDLVFVHVPASAPPRMPDARLTLLDASGADPLRAFLMLIEPADDRPAQVGLSLRPDGIDATEAEAFLDQFVRLASDWERLRTVPVDQLPLLDESECHRLLAAGRGPHRPVDAGDDVLLRFMQCAAAAPAATAVIDARGTYVYAQLAARSQQIAGALANRGVRAGDSVAVQLERSFELVACLLAILRLGAAYVPVDPAAPQQRVDDVLATSGARLLLSQAPEGQDTAPPAAPPHADAIAYVMFTSGSTGKPKGVQVGRAALANAIRAFGRELGANASDVFLSVTAPTFDIFGLELFLPLCTGGTLLLADRGRLLEPSYLDGLAERHAATLFQATPTLLHNLLDIGWRPAARMKVLAGGEAVTADVAARLHAVRELLNVYGPTEATIWASLDRIDTRSDAAPPIGRPLPNTQLHILDRRLQPVPAGVAGELYIAGIQLARGYAGRPDLTAERFLPNPFAAGERMYRTGDLARWRSDGRVEYLGRADDQLKINGHRIEPGEVAAVLATHPAIGSAAAVARDDLPGGPQLVGYFTLQPGWAQHAGEEAFARQQVDDWREVYERSYAAADDAAATRTVWTSSLTGEPYGEGEMREWTQATVQRLAAFGAQQVLEVGCGTGLVLRALAGSCTRYVGTDISAHALELLRAAGLPPAVELHRLAAHELDAFDGQAFDLIVLNSVVQYFPTEPYLRRVLAQCVKLLAPGGHLLVGDVRNLALLPLQHALAAAARGDGDGTQAEFARHVQQRMDAERELCLSPAYFERLAAGHGFHTCRVLARRGHAATEMNLFRFDAVLRRDAPTRGAPREFTWADWCAQQSEADCESPLALVRGIPDARVEPALRALGAWTHSGPAIEPETLHARAGSRWHVNVLPTRADGTFDAVLVAADAAGAADWIVPAGADPREAVANEPLRGELQRRLRGALREHLAAHLPDYMVPSFLVAVPELPVTTSGKLDRSALPPPVPEQAPADEPATNELEALVAGCMADVLGLAAAPGRRTSFFELGGHSLAAARLAARLRHDAAVAVSLRDVMDYPTPEALAARLRDLEAAPEDAPAARDYAPGDKVPLSHAQQSLWFLGRMQEADATYNIPSAVRFGQRLDAARLARALARLTQRHCVLRTVCREDEDGAAGVVLPPREDFALHHEPEGPALAARIDAFAARPFDLAREIPLRAALFDDGPGQVVVIVVHHIAGDATSCRVLWEQLAVEYEQTHDVSRADEPTLQYADFAAWQRQGLAGGRWLAQQAWWREQFEQMPAPLQLPRDAVDSERAAARAGTCDVVLPPALRADIERFAARHAVTPFAVLLGAYALLLARLAGQPEAVVGVPVANRHRPWQAHMVGPLMNTLPIRIGCSAATGATLVAGTHAMLKHALHNCDLPFDEIVRDLGVQRSAQRLPLFQAMFTFLEDADDPFAIGGAHGTPVAMRPAGARCELTLRLAPHAGAYSGGFEFDPALFTARTVERWGAHFEALVRSILRSSEVHPLDLALFTPAQHADLMQWSVGPAARDCIDVVELFERQARADPRALAVVGAGERIGYGTLDAQASALATRLRDLGVGCEDVVAVRLERGVQLAIAMLAVLKAGAAYLPLDTGLPDTRVEQVLHASGAVLMLDGSPLPETLRAARPSRGIAHAQALAYVIYTSGSTGEPKGVQVTRGALATFVQALAGTIAIEARDRILSVASISFDMFASEFFPFLCHGAAVVFADRKQLPDAGHVARLCADESVSCAIMTPSLAANLQAQGWLPPAAFRMMTGGEKLSRALAASLCARASLWNRYGPTEATIAQAAWRVQVPVMADPPVGRPFAGTRLAVLDARLQSVAPGVVGELYIAGRQLARGYLGRPDLTAERFLPDPFAAGERMYRTGDLARWNAEGELEILGRADRQVKLRGFRIEPAEIEQVLVRHASVQSALVTLVTADGHERLVAYIVPAAGAAVDAGALKHHAAQHLPAYMVPVAFIAIDGIPLNRNGKVDFDALPAPAPEAGAAPEPGGDPLEQAIAASMARLVGRQAPLARTDNFFEQGGHSLSAARLLSELRRDHGIDVPLKSFYDDATPAALASLMRGGPGVRRSSPLARLAPAGGRTPLVLVHGSDGDVAPLRALAAQLAGVADVWGLHSIYQCGADTATPLALRELASLYVHRVCDMLAPASELAVGGWSFGGVVAFEMARLLRERGMRVAAAFAIDSAIEEEPGRATPDAREISDLLAAQLQRAGRSQAEVGAALADDGAGGFVQRLRSIVEAHRAAAQAYRPLPAAGDFTVFEARAGAWPRGQLRRGWAPYVQGRFGCVAVDGDHWSVLQEPNVAGLAAAVTLLLSAREDRAGADAATTLATGHPGAEA